MVNKLNDVPKVKPSNAADVEACANPRLVEALTELKDDLANHRDMAELMGLEPLLYLRVLGTDFMIDLIELAKRYLVDPTSPPVLDEDEMQLFSDMAEQLVKIVRQQEPNIITKGGTA